MPLTTGMAWVTPSPLSMTIPVNVRSPTWRDVHEAARASTACTGDTETMSLRGDSSQGLHLRVLHDGAVLAGAVDFHQVLIHDTSGTDIQVTHFGVTHLSVRQTYVLTAGLQLRVRIGLQQLVPMGR